MAGDNGPRGDWPPLTPAAVELRRPAPAPSTPTRDGLARVCRVWGVARSTAYGPRPERGGMARRPGPSGPCTEAELGGHIRPVWQASPCYGEGDRNVWARLRDAGARPSPRRVLRRMRAPGALAPQRQGQPHGPPAHARAISTGRVDTLGGTEMTAPCTRAEGQVAICSAVDHGSAAWVGIHAATHGPRFEALEPMRPGVRPHLGAFDTEVAHGLLRRHEHGSQELSRGFQDERTFLGGTRSPACVRAPQGHGGAARVIRTLKEHLLWITTFDTGEALRAALLECKRCDKETWLMGRQRDQTPMQVRREPWAARVTPAA